MLQLARTRFLDRPWKRALGALALGYLLLVVVISLFESFLVYPGQGRGAADSLPFPAERVELVAQDGVQLRGWYLDHPAPTAHVLYTYGNGDSAARAAAYLDFLRSEVGVAGLVVDYRGYGNSEGRPSEAAILADLEQAHAWLRARAGLAEDGVVLLGRSLGGAMAVHLASRFGARGLVLECTFASLVDVAAGRFPWLPVRWMMRNRYPSRDRIATYSGRLLMSHGTDDRVVPYEQGRELFEAAQAARGEFVEMPGLGHNDMGSPEYFERLYAFLRQP